MRQRTMADEAEARIGTRLGSYLLRAIIGRGGMGVVYRAEHIYIQKMFAVKVLHGHYFDQPEARERFLHEAQAASGVDHPNIIGVTDFGEAPDGTIFLVMAHVEGTPLDEVLNDLGHIELFRAIGILNQITRALSAAHAKGILHQDLKPENIMLRPRPGRRQLVRQVRDQRGSVEVVEPEGTYDFVTILDFGAAKFFEKGAASANDTGEIIGTPAYMAPETATNGHADARSDVYAVGVIFYEMLTGEVPFDAGDPAAIMMMHVRDKVPPPSRRNPKVEITPYAEQVILKALEKDPAHRQQSMDDFHADLQHCFGSVRFRRVDHKHTPGLTVESLRRAAPPEAPTRQAPLPLTHVKNKAAPAPILLTKRKSGRHPTLPLGADVEGSGTPKKI